MEVRKMFGDTLLESSSAPRKGKRWPMATAFTAELIVGGLLVIIPLLSTGVIPLSARVPIYTPVRPVTLEPMERVRTGQAPASGQSSSMPSSTVVTLGGGNPRICLTCVIAQDPGGEERPSYNPYVGNSNLPANLADHHGPSVKPGGPKRIKSQLEEGQLVNRVEPAYPHIAAISGIQGQVKLHAIIGRDGRIQSLNVISGHPLLVRAALEAVEQWRYRPYVLNGEAVEVETLITVNFKKEIH
jgi:periplasmic protein TonB